MSAADLVLKFIIGWLCCDDNGLFLFEGRSWRIYELI